MNKIEMKSYKIMEDISHSLYLNLENDDEIKMRLEENLEKLQSQISNDFHILFGKDLLLEDFFVYVNDQTYRQSATGLILYETVSGYENFKIVVECIIDHEKIWLRVKEKPNNSESIKIFKSIESVQNIEGYSELKDIK